jgi:beta-galactosidase
MKPRPRRTAPEASDPYVTTSGFGGAWVSSLFAIAGIVLVLNPGVHADEFAALLPAGVRAIWDPNQAHREATPTRERICINGLWRWQPAGAMFKEPPTKGWGYFKVPGCWPGITDYLQKDSQTLYPHHDWKDIRLAGLTAAWYEREITIPRGWEHRRVVVDIEYLNSYATVFVDGMPAGEIRFPGGEVDLTPACRFGGKHRLSLLVLALPLKGVMLSYSDTASARQVKGTVPRRGLCGDVYLVSSPASARIADVRVDTSVREGQISVDAALQELDAGDRYSLRARIARDGRAITEFTSKVLDANDLGKGRITFTGNWKPDRLWDLHTPGNVYSLSLSLLNEKGQVLDTALDVRFGFREFWIDGRDFYLNGTRLFLSAVPLDNAQVGAAAATYQAVRESLERLKNIGINFVYTHNYGCEPGSHLGFAEVLRAADDVGMLVSFSQPHFGHYEWRAPNADRDNGYKQHAEFYVRRAQNHPSVVFYSMSHNATGYSEDMNPDLIDGIHDPRETRALNNSKLALRAEAIVRRLDPSRIVYHHSSGNLGSMHTSNFYPNFAPIQELSDWFEHWATHGVKPMFTCEYGAPFTWDWAMYRGWYKGERTFGSARVPWEFCLAEWNAQFLGDPAYRITEMEQANLRWEARQFRAGNLWHRWDYPYELGSKAFDDRHTVIGRYLTDNWRAFRTWGVSATSPWEHDHFWKLRDGVDQRRKVFPVDWDRLQRPGFSPDYLDQRYERMDLAFDRADWIPTADGQALLRNNRPLLAYLGGPPAHFTSKEHNAYPGETVEKQIIVINNSRTTVTADCRWSLDLPEAVAGNKSLDVPTGQQERILLRMALPAALKPGTYDLRATVTCGTGEIQQDSFSLHVLPRPTPPSMPKGKIALFDPKGETRELLNAMDIMCCSVDANTDLSTADTLIVGKAALTPDGPAPDISRVHDGLKVVVFEQTSQVLEKRLGFRVTEYGLRQIFPRIAGHPILAGIDPDHLRDWRGEATILPPRLSYQMRPRYGPTITWRDIPVTRVWRCGNRGNVASVLIEKPARGDFLPILDGGYSLQYSPLLEYREGQGMVLFCQLDGTGRTEVDPAGEVLARNIIQYVSTWKPTPRRKVVYAGDSAGIRHLEAAGIPVESGEGASLSSDRQVLVVGPGGGRTLAASAPAIAEWLKAGGHVLAIGLDEADANAFLPFKIRTKKAEHIAAYFDPFDANALLAGVGPADVHNRDPRDLPLITAGAGVIGNGVLARAEGVNVVFCQLVPWQFDDYGGKLNVKRTYRRAAFLVSRLLADMGVEGATPVLARFRTPVTTAPAERRWRDGLYLDQPEEWDDPYRFFRW